MELKTRYIPVAIKKQIVNQIIANCITEENGLITYDYFNYQLALDLSLVEFYYDGECDDIDKFYGDGSMKELYKIIPESEIDFITNAVAIAIQEKKEINKARDIIPIAIHFKGFVFLMISVVNAVCLSGNIT